MVMAVRSALRDAKTNVRAARVWRGGCMRSACLCEAAPVPGRRIAGAARDREEPPRPQTRAGPEQRR
jgi:hypothetical protein